MLEMGLGGDKRGDIPSIATTASSLMFMVTVFERS